MIDSIDVFSLVSPTYPDGCVAFGQPSDAAPSGFMIVAAESPSLIEAAATLARWAASPEWVLEHAPGFVLPVRCAVAVRFHTDREVGLISTLGMSTAVATLERGVRLPVLRVMPVADPVHSYEVSAPVILRELVAQADDSFDQFLSDTFTDLNVGDFL